MGSAVKLAAIIFFFVVPFLALRDAAHLYLASLLEGWGLAIDMFRE
jgi:hypothetical protein